MAIAILNQQAFHLNTLAATQTVTTFNVPSGTTRLLLLHEYFGLSSTSAPTVDSVTHNGDAVATLFTNAAGGLSEINTWWGQRANPDIGTFDIVLTFPTTVRGGKLWALAISGEKASGSILGATDSQRRDVITSTVGLGVTPASAGTSMLLASLGMARQDTTLTWTGTGFVEYETGVYGVNAGLSSTSRYRLNAPGSANTVSATFSRTDNNLGGSLIEILAEAAGVDVSGDLAFGLAFAGAVTGAATARRGDTEHINGRTSWTEILLLQSDVAGADRRILTAGPDAAPNYTLDMVLTGTTAQSVYRWRYRLADGVVTVETGAGTQTLAPHVIALVHEPGNPMAYVNGLESVSSRSGNLRIGILDNGAGGMAIAGHEQASPAPYTGLIGRYLVYDGALTRQQINLLATSLLDADIIWGYGAENDSRATNRSPVAMPMYISPNGQPSMTITPRTVDPDGTAPSIVNTNQGAHTSVTISGGKDLVLNFERGWLGSDSFIYTVADATKWSTAKISINQTRPALLARDDAITVDITSSIVFDPRANDSGAGLLRVTAVSQGSAGAVAIESDGRIRYTPNP